MVERWVCVMTIDFMHGRFKLLDYFTWHHFREIICIGIVREESYT